MTSSAPPIRPPPPRLLDPRVLLGACGEDEALLVSIAAGLARRLDSDVMDLRARLVAGDARGLRKAAHTFCGMIAACSSSVAEIASELEDCAASASLERAGALITQLEAVHEELSRELGATTLEQLQRAVLI